MTRSVFPCRPTKKRSLVRALKKVLLFMLIVCFSLTLMYNFQIIPALIPLATAQATTETTVALQNVIRNCVRDGGYTDFVKLRYGEDGNVASLETDTANIALVSGDIIDAVADVLGNDRKLTVHIPAGNLSGGVLFTGRGPDIQIQLVASPKITCDIQNEFFENGINQTLHRIIACVETEIYVLIPAAPQQITVTAEYCIAETVIVGKVPDAYTKINRFADDIAESEIDDIYDFGASAE